jgi:raffinose/stachyose/melibiose transport system substrate-binding protein
MFSLKRITLLLGVLLLFSLSFSFVAAQDEVIDWWHIQTVEDQANYWQQVADDFMAANPGVQINITVLENEAFKSQLVTVMQAGEPPDLFQSWGGGILWQFGEAGLLRDISAEMDADDGAWRNTFSSQGALNLFGYDGQQWGAPWNWSAVGMFYNKALFAEAGLDPDAPPATWTEFLDAIEALKGAGITPITIGEQDRWPGHFWYAYLALRTGGGDAYTAAYSREGAFTDEPFVQAYQLLADLVDAGAFQEGFLGQGYGASAGNMGRGEAAMHLMGAWDPPTQIDNCDCDGLGDDLGWFPFPAVEGGAGAPDDAFGGGDGFVIGKDAPDATVAFLQYITSPEVQRGATWTLPTVTGLEDTYEDDPITSAIVTARDGAPFFMSFLDQFYPPPLAQSVLDTVEGVMAGTLSPEEAASQLEDVASFELE